MDVSSLIERKMNRKIPDIAAGDTVKVHAKIIEGDRERIQVFQGVVLKISKGGAGASFTVRHVAQGIGVERTFPMFSENVDKVEIVRQGKVRRSRLYYLRNLSGKEARRKIKRVERKLRETVGEEIVEELIEEPVVADEADTEEIVSEPSAATEPAEEPKAEAPVVADAEADTEEIAAEEAADAPAAAEEAGAEAPVEEEPKAEAPAEEPAAEAAPAEEEKKEDA
jgi:large subunit ribosomal protein L19